MACLHGQQQATRRPMQEEAGRVPCTPWPADSRLRGRSEQALGSTSSGNSDSLWYPLPCASPANLFPTSHAACYDSTMDMTSRQDRTRLLHPRPARLELLLPVPSRHSLAKLPGLPLSFPPLVPTWPRLSLGNRRTTPARAAASKESEPVAASLFATAKRLIRG